jgi:hypothetical protein
MPETRVNGRNDGLGGQRADGSFEVSASKTLSLEQDAALDAVIRAVTAEIGAPPTSESRGGRYRTARWKLDGQPVILATANPSKAGRTSVSLTLQQIAESDAVPPAKATLRAWLAAAGS